MLLDGMPPEARTKRADPDEPYWGYVEELLAQVVEEVSIVASHQQRDKPRVVARPGEKKTTGGGVSALIAAMGGRVRHVGT